MRPAPITARESGCLTNHVHVELGHDAVAGDRGPEGIVERPQQSLLLPTVEHEQTRAAGLGPAGEGLGHLEQGDRAGAVVVGAVVDRVGIRGIERRPYAEVVVVGPERHVLARQRRIRSANDADDVLSRVIGFGAHRRHCEALEVGASIARRFDAERLQAPRQKIGRLVGASGPGAAALERVRREDRQLRPQVHRVDERQAGLRRVKGIERRRGGRDAL